MCPYGTASLNFNTVSFTLNIAVISYVPECKLNFILFIQIYYELIYLFFCERAFNYADSKFLDERRKSCAGATMTASTRYEANEIGYANFSMNKLIGSKSRPVLALNPQDRDRNRWKTQQQEMIGNDQFLAQADAVVLDFFGKKCKNGYSVFWRTKRPKKKFKFLKKTVFFKILMLLNYCNLEQCYAQQVLSVIYTKINKFFFQFIMLCRILCSFPLFAATGRSLHLNTNRVCFLC